MSESVLRGPNARHRRGGRIVLIITGSTLAVIAVLLVVVLIVGGLLVPAKYLEPWSKTYSAGFTDPRMKVVSTALLAPSSHNMQPWIIRLDPTEKNTLSLFADSARLTPAVDPLSRQTMVSQGTFLAYLRVAAAQLGYRTEFTLFPNGGYDETDLAESMRTLPVARITLSRTESRTSPNYDSLYQSDTNRDPYSAKPVTSAQARALEALAADSGAALRMLNDRADIARLGAFGVEGTRIETEYGAATTESDRLFYGTEGAKNRARSGFAVEGQGTTGFMKYLLQGAIQIYPALNDDATGAKRAIASTTAAVAHTPAYGLITTAGNTRADQVRAGILYADFSLTARTLGLVMQPISQVLQEYPSMAGAYRAVHAAYATPGQTIQMLVRVGTATSDYPWTMRRDARSLVTE